MSDFSLISARLQASNDSLREFDSALRVLIRKSAVDQKQIAYSIERIASVLDPIVESINGNLTQTLLIDEYSLVDNLRQRNLKNWQDYKERLISLSKKIKTNEPQIQQVDIDILNDIADAISAECLILFKRMARYP